jgi:hypothetical protein
MLCSNGHLERVEVSWSPLPIGELTVPKAAFARSDRICGNQNILQTPACSRFIAAISTVPPDERCSDEIS